jgi:O-antigen biosynthesis protein
MKIIHLLSIGRIGPYVFRKLNISTRVKNNIKDVVYQYAGFLFKNQPSYRMWKAIRLTEQAMFDSSQKVKYTSPLPIDFKLPIDAKKILIINETTPTPDRDSGSLDICFFMKAFIELGYNITFIPDDLKSKRHYTDNLRSLGVRCLTHLEIDSVEGFLREEGSSFNVVLLYRVHTARMHAPIIRKYAPHAKIVFDTVDLHFLREERQAVLDNSIEAQVSASNTKEAEFEMMRIADATIVLSNVEHDIVVEHDPSINVFCIPYMRNIPGCKTDYAERRDIIFIGGFLHSPNVDCIKYFVNDIWPIVRNGLPDVKFIILGSSPPDEILSLGALDSRIQVVGFVEDIDPYFNTCRISIAPIRFGAGIKGKIGTSASYGVPCVASSLAVEGMGLIDGVDVLVADTAEKFAEKIIKLYSDQALWNQLSNNSLNFMQCNYSYKKGKKNLEGLLNSLL